MPWMCTFVFEYLLFLSCESFSRSLKINNKTLIPVLYATSSEVLVMCNFFNLKLIKKIFDFSAKNGKYAFKNKLP